MLTVCFNCGQHRIDKIIDPRGPYAICPECGFKHPFKRLPLFVVGGASGTGKSTALYHLTGQLDEFVPLESDILWRAEFDQPETLYREFFETWLRMAKNISQAGRPVMVFGAGFAVPENLEPCVERRYFSKIHYLAFVCDDLEIERRLMKRPGWRNSSSPGFIQAQIYFNRWLKQSQGKPELGIELIDTTTLPAEKAAEAVKQWARGKG